MMRSGSLVAGLYDGGYLERRILGVDPGRSRHFSVVTQELGLEDCVTVLGGSQRVHAYGTGAELILTTRYHGHLQPRFLARSLERLAARQVHAHVIEGMTRKMETLSERAASGDDVESGWERILREGLTASRGSGRGPATFAPEATAT